jgi:uncharacterized protein YndB with AHSA1/START domain
LHNVGEEETVVADHVTREVWIEAPAEDVWSAVTGDGWLAEEVTLELRPGGEASFVGPDGERSGWIEDVAVPAAGGSEAGRLVFWWAADGESASRVDITLEPRDGRTRLRVSEVRPLDLLDVVGLPLRSTDGRSAFGPALAAA